MSSTGVSLLASKLKHRSQPSTADSVSCSSTHLLWAETIKLTDSVAPAEDIRAQLELMISQTNDQEKAMLALHKEVSSQMDVVDSLRELSISKNRVKLKYAAFLQWRALVDTSNRQTTPSPMETPRVYDSINLNASLRNLALSLASPENMHSASLLRSTANLPFKTARIPQPKRVAG